MKSLILIAHGSRLVSSNEEIRALTSGLRDRAGDRYAQVSCAFLELAEPSIPARIDVAVAAGSTHIVLLPYFLAGGTHVSEHIPEIISQKQAEYPQVKLELKPYLGTSERMVDLLSELA